MEPRRRARGRLLRPAPQAVLPNSATLHEFRESLGFRAQGLGFQFGSLPSRLENSHGLTQEVLHRDRLPIPTNSAMPSQGAGRQHLEKNISLFLQKRPCASKQDVRGILRNDRRSLSAVGRKPRTRTLARPLLSLNSRVHFSILQPGRQAGMRETL